MKTIAIFSQLLLQKLSIFLKALHQFCTRFHYAIIFAVVALLLSALYIGRGAKMAIRTEDFSNPELSSYKDMQALKRDYAMEDKLTLIFRKNGPLFGEDYCKIYQWLKKEVNTNQSISKFSSGFDLRFVDMAADGTIFYPKIFEDPCSGVIHLDKLKDHPLKYMFFIDSMNDFIVHFQIAPEKVPLKHGIYDYKHVKEIIDDAKKELPFELITGGTLFFQASVLDGVKQTGLLNIVTALLFIAGYFYFYRSKLSTLVLVIAILFTSSIIRSGMVLCGQKIDPLASCIFFMLIVAILEDYIFLSFLIFKKKMSFPDAQAKIILPSFLTSLTTAIGFGSLVLSPNPNVVHFGVWTSFGAILEWFLIFNIIPCFYKLNPAKIDRFLANTKTAKFDLKKFTQITPRKKTTYALMIVFAIFPFVFDKANLNYSPFDMFDSGHPISHFKSFFQETRNTEGEISIVFDRDVNPDRNFINQLEKIPGITKVMSLYDFSRVLTDLDPSLQRMVMSEVETSEIGKMFKSKSDHRLIAYTTSLETKEITRLQNAINEMCRKQETQHCKAVGEIIVSKDYAYGILSTLYNSFSFCFLLIIVIITWLTFAVDYKLTIPILLSVMWAPVALLITVVALQFNINIITCVALSVIVGIGGDNAIQFLLLEKDSLENAVKDYGQASVQTFFLLMVVSLSLLLSYFRTSKILSMLMLIGIVWMIVGDIWVLNGLLKKDKKKAA